jgi:hypothetical protein
MAGPFIIEWLLELSWFSVFYKKEMRSGTHIHRKTWVVLPGTPHAYLVILWSDQVNI